MFPFQFWAMILGLGYLPVYLINFHFYTGWHHCRYFVDGKYTIDVSIVAVSGINLCKQLYKWNTCCKTMVWMFLHSSSTWKGSFLLCQFGEKKMPVLFTPECFLAHLSAKLHLFWKHSSRYASPLPPHLPLSFNYCSNENDQCVKWQ